MTDKIPQRTDVMVLTADDPKRLTIGWTLTEHNGVTLFKFEDSGAIDRRPLTDEADIQEGDEIAVAAMGGGFHKMRVEKYEGQYIARCGGFPPHPGLQAILRFAEDERKCWTCVGLINMRGLKKLEITR